MKNIKKLKTLKIKPREFEGFDKLDELIILLRDHGYTEDDYNNFFFELNFACCYYEGDYPSIKLKYLKPY